MSFGKVKRKLKNVLMETSVNCQWIKMPLSKVANASYAFSVLIASTQIQISISNLKRSK